MGVTIEDYFREQAAHEAEQARRDALSSDLDLLKWHVGAPNLAMQPHLLQALLGYHGQLASSAQQAGASKQGAEASAQAHLGAAGMREQGDLLRAADQGDLGWASLDTQRSLGGLKPTGRRSLLREAL